MTTRSRHSALLLVVIAGIMLIQAVALAGGPAQTVQGRVWVPVGAEAMCEVLEATGRWATGSRDLFAYEISIAPDTAGKPYVLQPALPADVDIFFSGGEALPDLAERGIGPVHGTVPAGATSAFVCLVAGPPTVFTYVAG